jgi:hypothetical protein
MKFLGITIYEKLNWNQQINHCKTKISSGTYTINSLKYILPTQQLKTLYYSLLDSYLNYGILLCGWVLSVLHIKSIRKISNSTHYAWAAPLYSKLNILTLDNTSPIKLCTNIAPIMCIAKYNSWFYRILTFCVPPNCVNMY